MSAYTYVEYGKWHFDVTGQLITYAQYLAFHGIGEIPCAIKPLVLGMHAALAAAMKSNAWVGRSKPKTKSVEKEPCDTDSDSSAQPVKQRKCEA